MDKGLKKFEEGLISVGMPALVLLFGLALALSMINWLNFGLWSQIVGWVLAVGGAVGTVLGLLKLPKMF